jgi:biotin carboxyl carrier protein
LAALFLRAFFLRDFLAIVVPPVGQVLPLPGVDPPMLVRPGRHPERAGAWLDTVRRQNQVEEEGRTMADEIRAEMVANVWKVVVASGDPVSEGDTLVILESMKMEIPVVAESDGVVAQLAVNEGDVVQDGDLIAVIE